MSTASGNSVGSIFQNTSRVHPLLVTSTTIIPVQVFFFFLYFFGCAGSWLLHRLFSSCRKQGLFSSCSVWASHCSGFSWCEAWALGAWASVLGAHGLTSCSSWALEHKLNSCGTQAYLLRGRWDLPGVGSYPCLLLGRQIPSHYTTRETLHHVLLGLLQ